MDFKVVRPFIMEMITFIFVISGVLICLSVCNLIEITVHAHLLTVTAIVVVFSSLISLFSRIVPTGFSAVFDFAFQRVKEDTYVFLKIQPYRASIFTEKYNHNNERSLGMYYLVHVKKGTEIYTFISPSYVDLVKGEQYLIKSGQSSKIFITGVSVT